MVEYSQEYWSVYDMGIRLIIKSDKSPPLYLCEMRYRTSLQITFENPHQ